MLNLIKEKMFFWVANYFAYFAKKRLAIWKPRIVVVTGSTGKTTAFNLIEAQLGKKAYYSHHANSALGIPFNILGFAGADTFSWLKWISWFVKAPFMVDKPLPKERIYIVECDCDRPGEGQFLANLLQPEIVIWLNVIATHAMNFDKLITPDGQFKKVEEAIAYEFGFFVECAQRLVIVNGKSGLIGSQLARISSKNVSVYAWVEKDYLLDYKIDKNGTNFKFIGAKVTVPALLPKAAWMSVVVSQKLSEIFGVRFDQKFTQLQMPPGRSSLFAGIRESTLIDSTYNSSPLALSEMLGLLNSFDSKQKWLIIGDMRELGEKEKVEHEALAEQILEVSNLKKVLLLGERMNSFLYPILKENVISTHFFIDINELYQYIIDNLHGGEVLLFKGAQAANLEVIIEQMLRYPEQDLNKVARQTAGWVAKKSKLLSPSI